MGLQPPKAMKNRFSSATTRSGSATLPFVISTEAQRSGEICGAPCGLIHSVWLLFLIIFLGEKTADLSTAPPRISYEDPWL